MAVNDMRTRIMQVNVVDGRVKNLPMFKLADNKYDWI